MTAIIAMRRSDGGISIAADRRVTMPSGAARMSESKIFDVGPFIVGASGACTTGQVLQEWTAGGRKMPKWPKGMDARVYLRAHFVPALRKAIHKQKLPVVGDELRQYHDWEAIFCYDGRMFVVGGDGISVDEVDQNYMATGCGGALCLGAMYVQLIIARKSDVVIDEETADSMLRTAIATAAAHDVYCGDGADVVHQGVPPRKRAA